MMIEAAARKIIPVNPVEKMERLVNDRKEIKIITREEFKKLFTEDWRRVWDGNRISYTANKLAALTGMRAGEVLGLKGGVVYEDHVAGLNLWTNYPRDLCHILRITLLCILQFVQKCHKASFFINIPFIS
jgi:integrase